MLVMGVFGLIGLIIALLFDKPKTDKTAAGDGKGSSRPSS
jgi:hypothetical protein